MKYLRIFKKESDYTDYVDSGGNDYITPHLILINKNSNVKYKTYDITQDYCTIEALEDDLTVSFSENIIQYSIDNCQTWKYLNLGESTPTIKAREKISFKATGLIPTENHGIGTFTINKNFNLRGNVMSMLFGDDAKDKTDLTGYDYAFKNLFKNCNTLKTISQYFLPATKLSKDGYNSMFNSCIQLKSTPKKLLPALVLNKGCYNSMFYNCVQLIEAPELPATMLVDYCYSSMFKKCTNLLNPPTLSAMTLAPACYNEMFRECNSLKHFYELPALNLKNDCYNSMFRECSSLLNTPKIHAIEVDDYCCNAMFYGCTSLQEASDLYAQELKISCYNAMFYNCINLKNTPIIHATTLAPYCCNAMFYKCSNIKNVSLNAEELVDNCYRYIFASCTNLNHIEALFTTIPSSLYTDNWVNGVSPTGTFVKNNNATWNVNGVNGIPEGWTVETF